QLLVELLGPTARAALRGAVRAPARAWRWRMSSVTIEPIADLDAARADWTGLAEAAGSPFSTWEWADAWWRHFGDGRELLLHRCRAEDGRVAAILPLYLSATRPART